jgi:fatty-acyl-CoA synthase
VYEAALRFIYDDSDFGHTLLLSAAPLPEGIPTEAALQVFAGAGVARLTFGTLGGDFEERLAELESDASAGGAVVTQVYFRLTEDCAGAAVEILRRRGYFLGGALPRWFDDDGLLMQKVRVAADFEKIFVYGKRARKLKELIRQDMESVQPLTVGRVVSKMARLLPDKTGVIYPQRNRKQTYAELDEFANKVARSLLALGAEKGDHAAIWALNLPEYLPVELGCARAGMPLVMINTNYRVQELEYVLKQSDTTTLFLGDGAARPGEYLEMLQEVRERLPGLRQVILLGDAAPAGAAPAGVLTWQEFLDHSSKADETMLADRVQKIAENDIIAIQYTSGTTGAPKGVMLSHRAYVGSADAHLERQGLKSDDVVCLPLPFFHVYGSVPMLSVLMAGGTAAIVERFRAQDLLQTIETCRATTVSGTPTMFVAALGELSRRPYDLSSLRGGNMGGAFCPQELVREVVEKMGARKLGILYGSTEGLCHVMNVPSASLERRAGTVGSLVPGYEAKIIDPATGAEVDVGSPGEFCVRGPVMMTRYYKMEEATAKAIDAEGWLHSGDLATVDAAGFYRITGRIKDLIIRGGENIYPAEIEELLLAHPKVLDAQVVGIPCPYYGEDLVAFLRLKEGQTAKILEIKRYCRNNISINKVPATCFFVDQFPLTASGKVQKFKLRELAIQLMSER